jgi:hypothetical protein
MKVSDEGLLILTKICAYFSPPLIAGTSDWMSSIATGSSCCHTLTAGLGDLKDLLRMVLRGICAYWVVTSKVFLMMSVGSQVKRG